MSEERTLEELLAEEPESEQERLSRRQFLSGAMVGGAAGLAVAAGTGVAVWKVVDAEAQAALETADAEIARLQGLVELYEDLEKVGLDAVLEVGMAAVALPLEAVELGAKLVQQALDVLEEALLALQVAIPSAQESILWLEAQVSTVADTIEKLESSLAKVLDRATDNPVAEALADFVGVVLDNLPFGLGDRIRGVLEGLVQLVTGLDELVEGMNSHVLEPLREKWFSSEEGQGVGVTFVDPVVEHVLDPLQAHVGDLAALVDTWQHKLVAPTQQALKQRQQIREDIAGYKQQEGL